MSSKFRAVVTLTLVLAILTASSAPSQGIVSLVRASTLTMTLIGFIPAWNNTSPVHNPTITVTQGDTVSISLSSGDGAPHRFFVDVDSSGTIPNCPPDKCSAPFPPSTTYTFTVDFSPATYVYYCSFHPGTMRASFIVRIRPTVGGQTIPVDKLGLLAPYLTAAAAILTATAGGAYSIRALRRGRVPGNPLHFNPRGVAAKHKEKDSGEL